MTLNRQSLSLFTLRISIFIVMFMWAIDKFINPAHAAAVYRKFYNIDIGQPLLSVLACAEIVLLVGFLFGVKRFITYGLVLLLHGVSTLSSWPKYLAPFDGSNLMFFAALPMLAACLVLFLYRDSDQLLTTSRLR